MRLPLSGFYLVNKSKASDHHQTSSAALYVDMYKITHSYVGPASCQRHKNTHIHIEKVILGYRHPLTKSPQTRFMCCKFYAKKRREEKSVHFVWNSRFEVSDALELKQNSWLQRMAQVPPGFLKKNILCSTQLCLRGLRLAVSVQEAF